MCQSIQAMNCIKMRKTVSIYQYMFFFRCPKISPFAAVIKDTLFYELYFFFRI